MKYFLRILLIIGAIVAIYFAAITVVSIYYKEEIEHRVVTEINKNLKKPISIQHISISAFSNFPYVSFSLNDVLMPKSDSSKVPLLKLEKLQILFAPYNIFIKKFKVDEILIVNGYLDARVDSLGNRDFDIVVKKDSSVVQKKDPDAIINFNLKRIKFENVEVFYENLFKPKRVHLTFKDTETQLILESRLLTGEMRGLLYSDEITLRPGTLLKKSDLNVDLFFTFNMDSKKLSFDNCMLLCGEDSFLGKGSIDFKNKSFMNLNIKTKKVNIQHAFAIIPERWTKKLQPLHLSGNVDADVTVKISLLPGNQPNFNIDFATNNIGIQIDKLNARIHDVGFTGNLTSTDSITIENYKIAFKNFNAVINDADTIKAAAITMNNFKDPVLKADLQLRCESKTLFDIVKFNAYSTVGGNVFVDLKYDGKLNYLFGAKTTAPEITGYAKLNHVNLQLNKIHFAFDDMDGRIDFRNDSIRMKELVIKSGKTDMKLSGSAYNLFNSIFKDTTGLKMDIKFNSNKFYFSDFNSASPEAKADAKKSAKKTPHRKIHIVENSRFILPYDLKATFTGKVGNLYSRNYHGNNIELDIKMDSKKVKIVESMNSFGGTMNFTSDFIPIKNEIHCKTNINLRKFQVDQMFLAFNNFKQKMLTSNNIRGSVSGDIYTYFKISSALVLDTNSVYVNGNYTITKLELIRVEPLMKLTKVGFEEKDLERVTFDKITSSLSIKDHVLEMPRTLFVTNILYFYLDVSSQADGEMVFNVLVPVKNLKKKPDTKGLTNDSKAGLSIPLKITGKQGKLKVL